MEKQAVRPAFAKNRLGDLCALQHHRARLPLLFLSHVYAAAKQPSLMDPHRCCGGRGDPVDHQLPADPLSQAQNGRHLDPPRGDGAAVCRPVLCQLYDPEFQQYAVDRHTGRSVGDQDLGHHDGGLRHYRHRRPQRQERRCPERTGSGQCHLCPRPAG